MSLTLSSPQGRRALTASIVGSGMAFLDGTIVTVAAPHIAEDVGGGFAGMQWVLDGYLLTLGALVLVGGSLGDLLGKRRVFIAGTAGFAVASLLCALAPTLALLIGARLLQGVAAALLVPTSLALVTSLFAGEDRGRAIGAWSGLSGIFTAVGPFVGGALIDTVPAGWRWAFVINLPLAAVAIHLARTSVPEVAVRHPAGQVMAQLDLLGALLVSLGLALIVGPLIEFRQLGAGAWVLVAVGTVLLIGFVLLERRRTATARPPAIMPTSLFAIRSFTVANLVTFVVYGALSVGVFLVTVYVQIALGYPALQAGAAGLPITVCLALFSSWIGGLVSRYGPRWFLTAGPLVMAVGLLWLAQIAPGSRYLLDIGPAMVLFALGLVLVVAPVTTAALYEVGPSLSGTASGVNNAVARVAGLLAIAVLPLVGGISTVDDLDALVSGYQRTLTLAAALCAVGGFIAVVGFRASRPE